MNVAQVIEHFQQSYPGKTIKKLPEANPTEIICEIDPTSDHPDYDVAVAAIKDSHPHYHRKTTEVYRILKGTIMLRAGDETVILHEGESYTIKPGTVHSARGDFTLLEVTSRPGWTVEDHIIVQ